MKRSGPRGAVVAIHQQKLKQEIISKVNK